MANYEARLDRIEAAIAPKDVFTLVVIPDGQTTEQARAAHAARHCITEAESSPRALFLTDGEAVL